MALQRTPGIIDTNAKTAVEHLQARYKALSVYAKRMIEMAQRTKKPIPTNLVNAYTAAARDYAKFGQSVFKALDKEGVQISQVVLKDGEPIPDKSNPAGVRTYKISMPLMPPTFTSTKTVVPPAIPVPAVSGNGDEVGIAPLVLGAYMLGGLIFTGVAGFIGLKALESIKVIVHGPDYKPDRQVEAYLMAYERLTATGVDPNTAAQQAQDAMKPSNPLSVANWVGPAAVGLILVGGTYLLYSKASASGHIPSFS